MTFQLRYWDLYTDEYWTTDGASMSKFLEAKYAETLVYIPGICFSQAAMVLLLRDLTPVVRQRGFVSGVFGVVLAGGVVSEVVMALRCAVESVWDFASESCYSTVSMSLFASSPIPISCLCPCNYWVANHLPFFPRAETDGMCTQSRYWLTFWAWQLIFELVLVILPWIVIRRFQISKHCKHVICLCFGTRLLVMIAVIVQMVIYNQGIGYDLGFENWPNYICTPIVQGLGIITACVPYFRPFFDSVESAMTRSQEMRGGRAGENEFSSAPLPPTPSPAFGNWPVPKAHREDIEMINRPAKSHGLIDMVDGSSDVPDQSSSRVFDAYARLAATKQFPGAKQGTANLPPTY